MSDNIERNSFPRLHFLTPHKNETGEIIMRALMKMDKVPGVEFVDIEKPSPKDDEVLFQVKSTAICGSDLSCWKWNKAGEKFNDKYEAQYPFVLGHECCGIVSRQQRQDRCGG